MDKAELLNYIRSRIEADGSQKQTAYSLGISAVYLSDVMRGRREPGEKLLAALNLRREVMYTHKND